MLYHVVFVELYCYILNELVLEKYSQQICVYDSLTLAFVLSGRQTRFVSYWCI